MSQTIVKSQLSTDASRKYQVAKDDIEKLKTEIQTLISNNKNVVQPPNLASTVSMEPKLNKSPVKTQPIPSKSSPNLGKVLKNHVAVKQRTRFQTHESEPKLLSAIEEACKSKPKHYDLVATREFMKKRKEKLKLDIGEQARKKKESDELRQQKLENLRQKTQELVIENVMMKSGRNSAKPSEDKKPKIGRTIDVSKYNAQVEIKQFSRPELQSRRCRRRSFDHEPIVSVRRPVNVARNSPQRSKSVNRELRFDRHVADKTKPLFKAKSQEFLQKPNKPIKAHNKVDTKLLSTLEDSPKTDRKSKLETNASQTSLSMPKSELNLENKQNTFIKERSLHRPLKSTAVPDKHVKEKTKTEEKEKYVCPFNFKSKSVETIEKINTEEKEKYVCPFNFKSKSVETSSIENIPPRLPQNLQKQDENLNQIMINAIKEKMKTIIPQIKEDKRKDFPDWLQPSASVQPYPYNFISAVRTKLELETKKKVPETNFATNVDKNKKVETIKDPKNTEVEISKTNISVNKKSLDIKSVDIPQLVPPKVTEHSKTYSSHKVRKQLNYSEESEEICANNSIKQPSSHSNKSNKISNDSDDSDTTKNIPELPHEDAGKIVTNITLPDHAQNIDANILQKISLKFPKEIKIRTHKLTKISSVSDYSSKSDYVIPKNITLERNFDVSDLKLNIPILKNEKQYNLPDDIDRILNQYSDRIKSNQTSTISATEYEDIAVMVPQKPKSEIITNKIDIDLKHNDVVPTTSSQGNGIIIESKTIKKVPSIILSRPASVNSSVQERSLLNSPKSISDTEIKTDSQLTFVSENVIKTNTPEILNINNIQKLIKPELSLKPPKDKLNAQSNSNHIHLKLQAEVQLINSFNNSLQKVVSVEKSLFNTINFKRGCDLSDKENFQHDNSSICSRDLQLTQFGDNKSVSSNFSSMVPKQQELVVRKDDNPYVCLSLGLVDQMIQDEDLRLQHLSSVIKIRDKTLFDRTRGEIAWLEIKKKQFRENGQVDDVTSIKKKQRGLLIKLEQERYEMKRLKQAHKEAAKARKTALCEQKNLIKLQLSSTDQIPRKLRRLSNSERPKFGPVKVTSICESTLYRVDSQREVASQSSSRRDAQDVNVTTDSSVVKQLVQSTVIHQTHSIERKDEPVVAVPLVGEEVQKELSMKEANLDKRRKIAEETLQWRQRLEKEEEVVVELERRAAKPILLDDDPEKTRYFTGDQLNKIWNGFTGFSEMKYDSKRKYKMSKRSLDKLFQNAMKRLKELPEETRRSRLNGSQLLSNYSSFEPNSTSLDSSSSRSTEIKNLSNKSTKSAKRVPQIKEISHHSDFDKFESNVPTDENSLVSNNFKLEKSHKSSAIGSITQNENTSLDQQSSNWEEVSDELNGNEKLSVFQSSDSIRTNPITSKKISANQNEDDIDISTTRTSISKQTSDIEESYDNLDNKEKICSHQTSASIQTIETSIKSEANKVENDQVSTIKTSVSKVSTLLDGDQISTDKNDVISELILSEYEINASASSKITNEGEIPASKSLTVSEELSSVKTQSEYVVPEESSNLAAANSAVTESSIKVHEWLLNYNSSKNSEATTINESIATEISNYTSDSSRKTDEQVTRKEPLRNDNKYEIEEELSVEKSKISGTISVEDIANSAQTKSDKISDVKTELSINFSDTFHTDYGSISSKIIEQNESSEIVDKSESIIESVKTNLEDASPKSAIAKSESIISERVSVNIENESVSSNTKEENVFVETDLEDNLSKIATARSVTSEILSFQNENESVCSQIKDEHVSVETDLADTTPKSTTAKSISEKTSFRTENESVSSKTNEGKLSVESNLENISPKSTTEILSASTENDSVSEAKEENILSGSLNESVKLHLEDISPKSTVPNSGVSEDLLTEDGIVTVENNSGARSILNNDQIIEEILEKVSDAESNQLSADITTESNEPSKIESDDKSVSYEMAKLNIIKNSSQSSIRSYNSTNSSSKSELIIDLPTDKFEIEIQEELIIVLQSPNSEELQKSGLIESSIQSAKTVDEESNNLEADSLKSSNLSLQSNSEMSIQDKQSTIQNKSLVSIDEEETIKSVSKVSSEQEISLQDRLEYQNDASPKKSDISEQFEKSPTSIKLGSTSEYDNETFEDKNSSYSKQTDLSQKSSARTSDFREDSLEDYSKESSTGTSIKSEKFLAGNKNEPSTDHNLELSDTKDSSIKAEESNKLEPSTESLEKSICQNVDFPDATVVSQKSLKDGKPSSEESSIESLQKTSNQNAASPDLNSAFNRSSESSDTSISSAKKSISDDSSRKPSDANQIIKSQNSSPRSTKSHPENSSNTSNSSEVLEKSLDNSGSLEENKVTTGMDDTNVKGVKYVDVFKRVSEILADMTSPRMDKSPRVQDLYTTTYDIVGTSSENTSESGSPSNELSPPDKIKRIKQTPFRNEEEELLRKQLAIEREIKRIEQETIPFAFVREIPNKPPPPYKPPDFPLTHVVTSIIPTKPEKAKELISKAHDSIFRAYSRGDLAKVEYKSSKDPKEDLQRFVFDLCKEVALNVCKPKVESKIPNWKTRRYGVHSFVKKRSMDKDDLHGVLNKKVLQLLNFEPSQRNDSLIIRWCLKKRDHVDEILVLETQTEEPDWTNYEEDEDVVKENLTQSILNMLLDDTARSISKIMDKKKSFRWS